MLANKQTSLLAGAAVVVAVSVATYWRSKRRRAAAAMGTASSQAAALPALVLTPEVAIEHARRAMPSWAAGDHVTARALTGGTSNTLMLVQNESELPPSSSPSPWPRAVLVRGFGAGMDALLNRADEHAVFAHMSSRGLGARLLGQFPGGRIEELLPGRTLARADYAQPETISPALAAVMRALAGLHGEVVLLPSGAEHPRARVLLHTWLELACRALSLHSGDKGPLRFSPPWLAAQAKFLDAEWDALAPPIVFGHNDTQYGNVLYDDTTGACALIDLEYAGPNFAGFDLGNLFCECALDYACDAAPGFTWSPADYPREPKQRALVAAYVSARGGDSAAVERLLVEAQLGAMTSHFVWALWALVKAPGARAAGSHFSYSAYAAVRLLGYQCELERWRARARPQ